MTVIALAGNPNAGKTSLFNVLTGSWEYVGNWPGVTVEKKVGALRTEGANSRLVDLPGLYSLSPLTGDEEAAVRCLLHDPVDAVLNVVDASRLRRSLHLTIQLAETGLPLVVALNMVDVARRRGWRIDAGKLSACLGVPVLPVVARTGEGCPELLARLSAGFRPPAGWRLHYGSVLEDAVRRICESLPAGVPWRDGRSGRWLALQYLEGNRVVRDELDRADASGALKAILRETEARLAEAEPGLAPDRAIRRRREAFIDRIVRECAVTRADVSGVPPAERVDRIVTGKWLGIPIFLLVMGLVFKFTFDWLGGPLSGWLDAILSGPVTDGLARLLAASGASPFIRSLVLDGIVAGVGGVLVFVPQIFVLFAFLTLIEDSGYMARVAVVMDRLAETIGLTGKAFIPFIIGFGCNVPGVMAARTIEQPGQRLVTVLLLPLMSCPARLAVFSLFAGVFFPGREAPVVLSLYVLGIALAIVLAKAFSRFVPGCGPASLIIELPPYHLPQWRTLWRGTWEKGREFIVKAGTYIFGGSVLIWLLGSVNRSGVLVPMEESFLAGIGGLIAPLLEPFGFGTWQAGAALLTGFFAKEAVISTMNIVYGSPDGAGLQAALASAFTPAAAFGFMAFLLLYVPCLATVATIRRETRSAGWTWFAVGYSLALACAAAFVIRLVGGLLPGS